MKHRSQNIVSDTEWAAGLRPWRRWLAVPLLLCALLSGCQPDSAQQQLRQQLASMEQALESHDADQLMALVSDDFTGNHGMDYAALQQLVRSQMLLNAQLSATLGPVEMTLIDEAGATVEFPILLIGGNRRWLPQGAQTLHVKTGWRRETDDQWRVYHAQWSSER